MAEVSLRWTKVFVRNFLFIRLRHAPLIAIIVLQTLFSIFLTFNMYVCVLLMNLTRNHSLYRQMFL